MQRYPLSALAFTLSFALVSFGSNAILRADAQTVEDAAVWQAFTPPGDGAPDRTSDNGTTRDNPNALVCPGDAEGSLAEFYTLEPATDSSTVPASDRVHFLVHLPASHADRAVLSIFGESNDYDYERELLLPEPAGYYRLSLPADAPQLAAAQPYFWSLTLLCPGEEFGPNTQASVSGSLTPVEIINSN